MFYRSTNSMIAKTPLIKNKIKNELVNDLPSEAIYKIESYRSLHFAHKKNNKSNLTLFSTTSNFFIAIQV